MVFLGESVGWNWQGGVGWGLVWVVGANNGVVVVVFEAVDHVPELSLTELRPLTTYLS